MCDMFTDCQRWLQSSNQNLLQNPRSYNSNVCKTQIIKWTLTHVIVFYLRSDLADISNATFHVVWLTLACFGVVSISVNAYIVNTVYHLLFNL